MRLSDKAEELSENARGNITAKSLYQSGKNYFNIDYLNGSPIISYFDQEEYPHFYFYNQMRGIRISNNSYDDGFGWILDSNYCSAMWITTEGIHFTVGKEGTDIHRFVPYRSVNDVNVMSKLLSTKIHIQVDYENNHVSMNDIYFLVPRTIFNRQQAYIDPAMKYIKDRSVSPSNEYIKEIFDTIINQIEKTQIDKKDIPKPDSFDSNINAREKYKKIEKSIEQWSKIIKKYDGKDNSIKNIVYDSMSSPVEVENTNEFSKQCQEANKIGKHLEESMDLAEKNMDSYPNLPFDVFYNHMKQKIDSKHTIEFNTAKEWNDIMVESDEILSFLSEIDTTHSSIDKNEWVGQIELALKEQYPNVLHPIYEKVERIDGSLWEYSDFKSYSWQEFEDLIGSLYESLGYETQVTSDTADFGIDVWGSKDGEQTAIQAKKYQQGNSVGRETLQKLASTLAKGDADHAVVITTSSFARTAEDYAEEFGPDMEIIDGDDLIDMLNNSPMPPPA